jgi:hypothetical protein
MTPELSILQAIATGIRRTFVYDENVVFIAAAPDYDPNWKQKFVCEVTPGSQEPAGDGEGAQDGGYIFRQQTVILHCFFRGFLDQYSKSTMLIIEKNLGLMERMEAIRQYLELSSLPTITNPGTSDFFLQEPIRFTSMGDVDWEDRELKIIHRAMTFRVIYGAVMPEAYNIGPSDYE